MIRGANEGRFARAGGRGEGHAGEHGQAGKKEHANTFGAGGNALLRNRLRHGSTNVKVSTLTPRVTRGGAAVPGVSPGRVGATRAGAPTGRKARVARPSPAPGGYSASIASDSRIGNNCGVVEWAPKCE